MAVSLVQMQHETIMHTTGPSLHGEAAVRTEEVLFPVDCWDNSIIELTGQQCYGRAVAR